jgi:hypothetical protein
MAISTMTMAGVLMASAQGFAHDAFTSHVEAEHKAVRFNGVVTFTLDGL